MLLSTEQSSGRIERFKYRKGIFFCLEDERTRPIQEAPRSVATVRFEEGAHMLMFRFLQSLQVRRMLVIIVKMDEFSEIRNPKSQCILDRISKDL